MPDDEAFGARLALVRQRMGWGNVKEAALACGLPVESWRGWERDGRLPRDLVGTCRAIAQRTGADVNWLAGLANDRGPGQRDQGPGIGGGVNFVAPATGLEPVTCRLTRERRPDQGFYPRKVA